MKRDGIQDKIYWHRYKYGNVPNDSVKCEYGNVPNDSVKCEYFLGQLSGY